MPSSKKRVDRLGFATTDAAPRAIARRDGVIHGAPIILRPVRAGVHWRRVRFRIAHRQLACSFVIRAPRAAGLNVVLDASGSDIRDAVTKLRRINTDPHLATAPLAAVSSCIFCHGVTRRCDGMPVWPW